MCPQGGTHLIWCFLVHLNINLLWICLVQKSMIILFVSLKMIVWWLKKCVLFLRIFTKFTNLFSSSDYPTSNLYLESICKIESLLKKAFRGEDPAIKKIATRMHAKFDIYWHCYSMLLSFSVVLDLHHKLPFFKYVFKFVYDTQAEFDQKVREVQLKMVWL